MGALFAFAFVLNWLSPIIMEHRPDKFDKAEMETLWVWVILLGFGWACAELARKTKLPSFSWQLFIGIILHNALRPLMAAINVAVIICKILAAIILKSGGDEVERLHFKKIALPTMMLAIPGFIIKFGITFFLLLLLNLDAKTAVLISAIIGSTDPAALIPTFKNVPFKTKHKRLVDISVAESAFNDAVGAIFTTAIGAMILTGVDVSKIVNVATGLVSKHNLGHLGMELLVGILAGHIGGWLMRQYGKHKFINKETSYDFGIIVTLPVAVVFMASYFEGNGFLAAFIAGLAADFNRSSHHLEKSVETQETKIDSIAKPVIFMMAGPFISINELWETAGIGFVVFLFSMIARSVAVIVSLRLANLGMKVKMTWRETWFMCIINETGVIPIVLAVMTVAQFTELTMLMPLTAWVVIWTLGVLPAITPWWAKILKLTEPKP